MNNLSWLLYAADVATSVSGVLAVSGVLSLLGGGLIATALAITDDEKWRHVASRWWMPMIAILIACVLPSRETIYAIAASEMGEEALKSPVATKAMKALDAWLDRQIDEGKSNA